MMYWIYKRTFWKFRDRKWFYWNQDWRVRMLCFLLVFPFFLTASSIFIVCMPIALFWMFILTWDYNYYKE